MISAPERPPAERQQEGVLTTVRDLNRATYANGRRVRKYIADDGYHALRRAKAMAALAHHLSTGPSGPALEIGSSSQSLLNGLPADRPTIVADITPGALTTGNRVCLDVNTALPFASGSLAAIVVAELIEHVVLPLEVIREFHRVLKPGGVLVVTTPNLATLQDRVRFLAGRAPRQVDCLHPYLYLHIRQFTASSLIKLLTVGGFASAPLESNYVSWRTHRGAWFGSRRLACWWPSLGGSLIATARRN